MRVLLALLVVAVFCLAGAVWRHSDSGRFTAHYNESGSYYVFDSRTGAMKFVVPSVKDGKTLTLYLDTGKTETMSIRPPNQ